MKSGITPKSIAISFVVVLVLYIAVFNGIEWRRHRRGPWEVTFLTDSSGNPAIIVYQPALNISSVELVFLGEHVPRTNLAEKVLFDRPLKPTPFGKVLYEDLTFLPGVVTFDLFGHEVELLPRVLLINKKEIPWKSDAIVELSETNKPAIPPKPPRKRSARLDRLLNATIPCRVGQRVPSALALRRNFPYTLWPL